MAFFAFMDIELFLQMLNIDSTSGREAELADFLSAKLAAPGRHVETFEVGDGTRNILVSWGTPKVVFCTHLDTVPPYISPSVQSDSFFVGVSDHSKVSQRIWSSAVRICQS
mgnify:CR=1 FL=1